MQTIRLPVLLLLFLLPGVLCDAWVVESDPTYVHHNQRTGEVLTCAQCPPGTHMTAHCTATTPTKCAPCKREHFTELWNYLPRCLYCNTLCTENQEVETECSPVSNRVCRCKEGFYWSNEFCIEHSECGPGYGVQSKGTSQRDTVCAKCSKGYFSNSSSALEPCVKHRQCASDQIVLLPGSQYQGTLCASCEDLANSDETLRTLLSGLFRMNKIQVSKLKKFVNRNLHTPVPRKRDILLRHVQVSLAHIPVEQLRKMPQMLKNSQLSSMAKKLERARKRILQQCHKL